MNRAMEQSMGMKQRSQWRLARIHDHLEPEDSIFSLSDFFQLDDLLSSEDIAIRKRVRDVMEKHVAPAMTKYWEKAEYVCPILPASWLLEARPRDMVALGCPYWVVRWHLQK